MTNYPQMGTVRVTWSIFRFWGPHGISGTGEIRHIKFGMQIHIDEY